MFCPRCGRGYEEPRKFCIECGCSMAEEAAVYKPIPRGSHWPPILIMIILSLIGIILFFATAGKTPAADGSCFQLRGGVLSFREELYTGPAEVTVPEQVDGMTVTDIGGFCFAGCTDITTVILPDTVEIIDYYAFEGCTALRGIKLPDSLSYIGDGAFAGCNGLEAVSIPGTVGYIAPDAFEDCPSLRHVFYGGTWREFQALYGQILPENTNVYCTDGNYCQGIPIP